MDLFCFEFQMPSYISDDNTWFTIHLKIHRKQIGTDTSARVVAAA